MKVLVTGATGFTGGVLARKLHEHGASVRVLVRDRTRLDLPPGTYEGIVEADLKDRDALAASVRDIDQVFHIGALFRQAGVPDAEYWDVNLHATAHLLEESRAAGVARFIHCSTVGVHGDIENPPADENYRFAPGDIYQITKLAGEKKVLEFGRQTGFPVSVIRPGPIYGPGDLRLLKLFRLAAKAITPIIGNGQIFFNMVYVEDLADLFILTASSDRSVGQVFLGAGPENMPLNQIVTMIAEILGRPTSKFHIPALPFQLLGSACEKVCIPLGIEPPIYRRRVDFFTKSRAFSIAKAQEYLGYEPKYGYQRGLASTIEWYQRKNLI